MSEPDPAALNRETQELWNRKAAFWDAQFGDEGNVFHRTLVGPAVERLLEPRPGEEVLAVQVSRYLQPCQESDRTHACAVVTLRRAAALSQPP